MSDFLKRIFVEISPWRNHPSIPDVCPTVPHKHDGLHVHSLKRNIPERGQMNLLPFSHGAADNCNRRLWSPVIDDRLRCLFQQVRPCSAPWIIYGQHEIC